MTWLRLIALAVLLGGSLALSGPAAAQAAGQPPTGGCARYAYDKDKQAKCEAREAQARKLAERKQLDNQRIVERRCAATKDDQARADCEKREQAKLKN